MGEHNRLCVWNLTLLFSYFGMCFYTTTCATMQDTNTTRDLILANYSTDTLPVTDQSAILYIYANFYLRSIIELDEPKGEITTTMSLLLTWTDDNLKWDGLSQGNQYIIRVDPSKIWTPSVVLGNPGSSMEAILDYNLKALVVNNGQVSFSGANVMTTICDIDITYFPFDVQKCDVIFQTWDYGPNVKFWAVNSTMDLSTFMENGVWSLLKTEVYAYSDATGYLGNLRATIYLERRSLFYVLNFLAPILILVLLNSTVFLLPTDSGERVGFAVTILLSIAVYMTIISDKLPETSNPTSVLSYILISYLLQSASICIETVASLRCFHRDDLKPVEVVWIKCFSCSRCKSLKQESDTQKNAAPENDFVDPSAQKGCGTNKEKSSLGDRSGITWTKVSKSLDKCFLCFNIVLSCSLAFAYLISVSIRPKY